MLNSLNKSLNLISGKFQLYVRYLNSRVHRGQFEQPGDLGGWIAQDKLSVARVVSSSAISSIPSAAESRKSTPAQVEQTYGSHSAAAKRIEDGAEAVMVLECKTAAKRDDDAVRRGILSELHGASPCMSEQIDIAAAGDGVRIMPR